jgi:hypothetical protein
LYDPAAGGGIGIARSCSPYYAFADAATGAHASFVVTFIKRHGCALSINPLRLGNTSEKLFVRDLRNTHQQTVSRSSSLCCF